jgi:hypothetical protein
LISKTDHAGEGWASLLSGTERTRTRWHTHSRAPMEWK